MSKPADKRSFRSLAETASLLLDPILRKRAGLNIELIDNWAQLVGSETAKNSMPLKIVWARRVHQDDPFQPATLVVACEGFAAMKLTHESGEIIQRINVFFGYAAIHRIKIEQKPVNTIEKKQAITRPNLDKQVEIEISKMTECVEDQSLRQSLFELGRTVFSDNTTKPYKKFNK